MFQLRKVLFLFVLTSLFLTGSCKKETSDARIVFPEKINKGNKAEKNFPVMTFETPEHDFGIINSGDQVVYDFKFKNTGKTDLVISNAKGSCGCTVPEFSREPIKPGGSGIIKVSFSSVGKLGTQSKSVRITANTFKGRERIKIKAIIKPRVDNQSNKN